MSQSATNLRAVGGVGGVEPVRPAIRIANLQKSFGKLTAIDRVSVDIAPGEFFMIVGPSGCGKTTLLRILAGLDTATGGSIEIETPSDKDQPVNSMVFQGDSIFPWMTVWNNAAYGLRMRNAPVAVIKERVGHYLDATGLTRFADYYPHQLSGGMKQRVSIARGLVQDPPVLLMDEPFAALDEQTRMTMGEELLRIWSQTKKTVVFVTHSLTEAVYLADEVLVMSPRPGRIIDRIEVALARPRTYEMMASDAFGSLRDRIWRQIRSAA